MEQAKQNNEVLSFDKNTALAFARRVNEFINRLDKFIDEFNEAHSGLPIQFNEHYTRALMSGRLADTAGVDFDGWVKKQPKFTQENVRASFRDHIEPIYHKALSFERSWHDLYHKIYDATKKDGFLELLHIADDGRMSITPEFTEAIEAALSATTNDIPPELLDQVKLYVDTENELKGKLGGDFKGLLSSLETTFGSDDKVFDAKILVKRYKGLGLS